MNKYNFTEGRYIVGFDLGGTLLEEGFPKLHTIPKEISSNAGIEEEVLSQLLLYSMDQLINENQRISDEQIPAKIILEEAINYFKINISIELLEEAAWHLLGENTTSYLKPLPNAHKLLEELKQNGAILIALSNTAIPSSILDRILEVHNMRRYFSYITLSSECGWRKPHIKAFEQMESSINLTFQDSMTFIGNDYEADILPAIQKGYKTVYIGNNNLALNSYPKPDIYVENIEKLIGIMSHDKSRASLAC
ncbi:HAD family hydrolase [Halotia wernerae UHCC 0503]|nr:HAD family hydrolase [Halotia wernerae UHCC 0503]